MGVWKVVDDAAAEACLPVWLMRRRPDPQDSLSETDEAGEDGGHSDQYLLDQQFESTNPGVAPSHTVHMINLPYIFAELNAETKAWEVWLHYKHSVSRNCSVCVIWYWMVRYCRCSLDSECVVMQTERVARDCMWV